MFNDVEYQREYRKRHKEKLRAYGRRYYQENKEEHLAYQKLHRRIHKKQIVARNRENKYGVNEAAFAAMLEEQQNACAICEEPFVETPHIDHDHKCCGEIRACPKCLRGLLCKHCNRGIGCLKDSTQNLERAISYLKKYQKPRAQ